MNVTNENIHDFIEKWHESDSEVPLHEYLGLTWDEYSYFVKTDELPKREIRVNI